MDGIGSEKPCRSFWSFSFHSRIMNPHGWMDGWVESGEPLISLFFSILFHQSTMNRVDNAKI